MAIVSVAGQKRDVEVEVEHDSIFYTKEPIQFRHRTGQKTYTSYRTQLHLSKKDGIYRPVPMTFLRKQAFPIGWGEGTAVREYC